MHILTVRSVLPDMGPGTQPLVIARQMRDRGHTVSFATSGGAYTDAVRAAGFDVHIVPELAPDRHDPLSVSSAIRKLAQIIRLERPDVVHGHNAAATICAYMAGRMVGRRLACVTSVRGVEERASHQWRNQVWKYTPGLLLGVCQNTKDRLLTFGVPASKIRVTYNGVDLARFNRSNVDAETNRKLLGLQDKIVVGTTGAMTGPADIGGPGKGQHILVQAMALLKDRHPDLSVLLVGDGPMRGSVEAAAINSGVEDRVVFAGRRFDVPEMLSAMDIYCLASIHGEFFPNSIIEAMAMELPWIGSDIAGLKELTADGQAGWVSEIGNIGALAANLDRLASDAQLRRVRGLRAREEVAAKFSIEKVTDNILGAYAAAGTSKG